MYGFEYDAETGGLLLNNSLALLSCEPRPVYAMELDVLGIDSFWKYEKQNTVPYMWAEANKYYYRGTHIFSTAGGSLYKKPDIEIIMQKDKNDKAMATQVLLPQGTELKPIDISAMCAKNAANLNIIEQITLKKIYAIYKKYKDKLDCFHVAFSGGKDSIVLLELVKKALPHNSFIVVFGDTKMEFPDTYKVVDIVEKQCKQEGISFYRAASHLDPQESWRLFGPPSRVLRWCCTVHKAAPQTLKIREVLGKDNYVGMDFVGVRAQESVARSSYEEENYGKKQKGQYSHNSILDWTSAEIWLYIYSHNLPVNEAYKKGNSRAGCLFCPMSTGKSSFFQHNSYTEEVDALIKIIYETVDDSNIRSYVENGGFNSRRSGRDLKNNEIRYSETEKNGKLYITVSNKMNTWKEWKKTCETPDLYYDEYTENDKTTIVIDSELNRLGKCKLLKQALRKTAYCVSCRACEANCPYGALKFTGNRVSIENCRHCGFCHKMNSGCLAAESKRNDFGEQIMKTINTFDSHAPKQEWVKDFFLKKEKFIDDNNLGNKQQTAFKRFLRDSSLCDTKKKKLMPLGEKLTSMTWNSVIVWGLMLVELAYNNPQFKWYIDNMEIGVTYSRNSLSEKLENDGLAKKYRDFVISALTRIFDLPLGHTLKFGNVNLEGKKVVNATRTKMENIEPEVLLYSLYRYAEACDGYYQFTLSTLMDTQIQSAGISPVKLFGFDRDEMEAMLRGLSAKYPDYIDVSFTHDLEKINLRDYHKSADILQLL